MRQSSHSPRAGRHLDAFTHAANSDMLEHTTWMWVLDKSRDHCSLPSPTKCFNIPTWSKGNHQALVSQERGITGWFGLEGLRPIPFHSPTFHWTRLLQAALMWQPQLQREEFLLNIPSNPVLLQFETIPPRPGTPCPKPPWPSKGAGFRISSTKMPGSLHCTWKNVIRWDFMLEEPENNEMVALDGTRALLEEVKLNSITPVLHHCHFTDCTSKMTPGKQLRLSFPVWNTPNSH